jgi:glutathione S-transferase
MSEPLTLIADSRFVSPWVLSVWTALKEKNLSFTVQTLDLAKGEARAPAHVRASVTGKVPALRVGDRTLSESFAILEYIEDAYPSAQPLLAHDLFERARDRQLMSWLRTDLFQLRKCMPFEGITDPGFVPPPMTAEAHAEADKLLQIVATRAVPSHARQPTMADFELAFAIRRLIRFDKRDLAHHALATAFSNELWKRPSVQSWVKLPRNLA